MLTKNLLRFKRFKNNLQPIFLNVEDENWLTISQQLIQLFESAAGHDRRWLESEVSDICEAAGLDAKVLDGLVKLLTDKVDWEELQHDDLQKLRKNLFLISSQLLAMPLAESTKGDDKALDLPNLSVATAKFEEELQDYYHKASSRFGQEVLPLTEQLYSDLPLFQKIRQFAGLNAEQLLNKYNVAQVQGLLMHTQALHIIISASHAGKLRQMLKYLRFFQLLIEIKHWEAPQLQFVVDGPLNLFINTKKYGLNLANFFPALLHFESWQIECTVELAAGKSEQLKLNQGSSLRPIHRFFHDFIPHEYNEMLSQFNSLESEWSATEDLRILPVGKEYCVPDVIFRHRSGQEVALELFHPWHAGPLHKRLNHLDQISLRKNALPCPLLIGVHKALLKNKECASRINSSRYFQKFGFHFRDTPSLNNLHSLLTALF